MKRIVMMMCGAIVALFLATNLFAQSHSSTINRSEQFILDSMRMELDMASIEVQHEMYNDSLQHQLDQKSISYNTVEEISQLFIPISFFAFIILIVWLCLWSSHRKQHERYRIIEKAVDNGQSIPEGLFDEPKETQTRWIKTLRHAVIYLALSIGAALFAWVIEEETITAIACIPGMIGLGYLLIAFIERREQIKESKDYNTDKSDTPCNLPSDTTSTNE